MTRTLLPFALLSLAACGGDTGELDTAFDTGGLVGTETDTEPTDDCPDTGHTTDTECGQVFYLDADGDGYGDADQEIVACERPDYAADTAGDCDDLDATVNPDAAELCDGADDDCDGAVDEDGTDGGPWYADADGDGFGDPAVISTACDQPSDHVLDTSDCLDSDGSVFPGSTATETPGDGIDADCDGLDACTDATCDGQADLLVLKYWNASGGYSNVDSLLVANDGGDFTTGGETALSGASTWWGDATDLDQDGYVDLILVSSYAAGSRYTDALIYWGSASGYSDSDTTALPTIGAVRVLVEDLDGDGWHDLTFANASTGGNRGFSIDSTIYWSNAGAFDAADKTDLPTNGAWMLAADDLDQDGHTDLVVCNYYSDSEYYDTDSFIYWGRAGGYSETDRTGLPTSGCRDVQATDLDGDGLTDLIFANSSNNAGEWQIDATIYWNSASGFDAGDTTGLPGSYSHGLHADDFDGDGDVDVVVGSLWGDTGYEGESYAYWNDGGFDPTAGEVLAGHAVYFMTTADLDGDGLQELILPGAWDDDNDGITDTRIYWGHEDGFGACDPTLLTTDAPGDVSVGDLDGDGYPELVFPAPYGGGDTLVFWGSEDGYGDDLSTSVTSGAGGWMAPILVGETAW